MTRQQLIELWLVIEAWKNGKTIQRPIDGIWVDVEKHESLSFTDPANRYRIKPEPRQVPMTTDDLPSVCWVRELDPLREMHLVCSITTSTGFRCHGISRTFSTYDSDIEWSADRKTWHPFTKEVKDE